MSKLSTTQSREYYEMAYGTEAWRRTDAGGKSIPGHRFTKMWYRALLEHLAPRIDFSGKRVLEVGCGNGFLLPFLSELGAEFVGIDIAHTALAQVPKQNGSNGHAVLADAGRLPFANSSFDILICMEVLEHSTDPELLVSECFRVIRPSGKVVFSCPNYLNFHMLPKVLANIGVALARRYMRHQFIDRTMTAFRLRKLVRPYSTVVVQRAVRFHPPLFEQLDYRLSQTNPLIRLNDALFALEKACGDRAPFNYIGLHTILLLSVDSQRLRARSAKERCPA